MTSSKGYVYYIVNPKSGASSNKRLASGFKNYLLNKQVDVRVHLTQSLSHARELANEAAVDYECSLVAAAGGDGTIRETMQGLEGSDKPMLIVPCGTENLLGNELGFNLHLDTLVKAYEGGEIRSLDLGTINGRCFTSISGFGFDGDVIDRMEKIRTGHINHLDYFWPIWRSFWEHKFPSMKVTVDREMIFDGRGMVFVGNISRYALGLQILKKADYGDGLLDVCIYRCSNQAHLLKHAAFTIAKLHTRGSDVIYRQGKEIRIDSDPIPIYSQIDGDAGPLLPADIKIIEKAIKVLVPPNSKPAGIRTRLRRMIG